MGRYHNTFYGIKNDENLCASSFKHIFTDADISKTFDDEGGSIQFIEDDRTYSLMIVPNKKLGMMAVFSTYNKSIKRTELCVYSVGDVSKMNNIEDVGDEEFYPIGAFVMPSLLWQVVQQFFVDPTQPSPAMQWMNDNEIAWPDN